MSFWDAAADTAGSFESSNSFEPIPNNTTVQAVIDKAEWGQNTYNGDFIAITWSVLSPSDYANRKVFQNIKVNDDDEKKAEKAVKMLAAVDYNAGGKLQKSGEEPTDKMLGKALTGKQMLITLQVWNMKGDDGEARSGNWVSSVAPKGKAEVSTNDDDLDF